MIIDVQITDIPSPNITYQKRGSLSISCMVQFFIFREEGFFLEMAFFPSIDKLSSSGLWRIIKKIGIDNGIAINPRVRYASLHEKKVDKMVIICKLVDSPNILLKAVNPRARFLFDSKKLTATVRGTTFCKLGPAIARMIMYMKKNCHSVWTLLKVIIPIPTNSADKNIIHLGPNLSTLFPMNGLMHPAAQVPNVAVKAMVFLSQDILLTIRSCTPPNVDWAKAVAIN